MSEALYTQKQLDAAVALAWDRAAVEAYSTFLNVFTTPDLRFAASTAANRIRLLARLHSTRDTRGSIRQAFDDITAANTVTILSLAEMEQVVLRAIGVIP